MVLRKFEKNKTNANETKIGCTKNNSTCIKNVKIGCETINYIEKT